MKKSILVLATLLVAVVAAVASQAREEVLQSAFKRVSPTQCDPITVNNCSTTQGPACLATETAYDNAACTIILYKVN